MSKKTVVVTGGTSGIGASLAAGFAERGAAVAAWGRRFPPGEPRLVDDVYQIHCDVSQEESIATALELTTDAIGPVNVCLANAGVSPQRHPFVTYPTELWRQTLRTNLDGVFFTFRSIANQMVESGAGGSLIAISSLVVDAGFPQRESYAASKTGVLGIVRSLAVELARYGIRANAVLPGWIETALMDSVVYLDGADDVGVRDAVLSRVPMRRFGNPEDLLGIALYLASDASRYHTGDSIRVDGGYSVM